MTKEFNSLEELKPYYDEKTNTYNFKEEYNLLHIKLNFDLCVGANITARNIDARGINAMDITAWNINAMDINACNIIAWNITACDIDFYAVCVAYGNIECNFIKGRKANHIMKALDGEIIIKGEGKC